MITKEQMDALNRREVEFNENDEWISFNTNYTELWENYHQALQGYIDECQSASWKNGYMCGLKDSKHTLEKLSLVCKQLADNCNCRTVTVNEVNRVIWAAMEVCGYQYDANNRSYHKN